MKKPNLFILGAPKCGTTALAKWLSTHPEVYVSPVKEPHYFSEEHRLTPTIEAYEALFADADESHRWVCEASVWHLFSETAVPNILRYSPDARFIVMVRNPLQMAPSLHEQHRYNGNELVGDFAAAVELNEARSRGESIGIRAEYMPTQHMAYFQSCALGWQLERLLGWVSSDRIHIIVFDDLQNDPVTTFGEVLRFLEIEPIEITSVKKVNAAKRRKSFLLDALVLRLVSLKKSLGIHLSLGMLSHIRRWNVQHQARAPQVPAIVGMMASTYGADIALLEKLLSRDLSRWLPDINSREGM